MEDPRDDVQRFATAVNELLDLYHTVHVKNERHALPFLQLAMLRVRVLAEHHNLPVTIPFPQGGGK